MSYLAPIDNPGFPVAGGVVFSSARFGSLAMATQPIGGVSGAALPTQPIVNVLNAAGALDTSFSGPVTVVISGSGVITAGTTTVSAIAGVVTFVGLIVTGSGVSTFTFTTPGRTAIASSPFTEV